MNIWDLSLNSLLKPQLPSIEAITSRLLCMASPWSEPQGVSLNSLLKHRLLLLLFYIIIALRNLGSVWFWWRIKGKKMKEFWSSKLDHEWIFFFFLCRFSTTGDDGIVFFYMTIKLRVRGLSPVLMVKFTSLFINWITREG